MAARHHSEHSVDSFKWVQMGVFTLLTANKLIEIGVFHHFSSLFLTFPRLETVSSWPTGQLPTAEMLAQLLRAEQAQDVQVIDLERCDRRDLGCLAGPESAWI